MELINQAIKVEPENYNLLATKGWGLYKQEKLKESFEMLKESWELRPLYNHELHLHIQEVEKALANQNR